MKICNLVIKCLNPPTLHKHEDCTSQTDKPFGQFPLETTDASALSDIMWVLLFPRGVEKHYYEYSS